MSNQSASEQGVDALPYEERGMPSVNDSGPSTAKRGLIVISLLLILCAGGGVAYWKYQKNVAREKQATAQQNLQLTSSIPTRTFSDPPSAPVAVPVLPGVVPVVPALAGTASVTPALPGDAGMVTAGNGKPVATLDKSGSALMVVGGKPNNDAEGAQPAQGLSGGESGQQNGAMAELLSGTRTPTRKAGMIGNQDFILAKGSFIDCALQTRLDSTVPGMTACVLTRNIYSDNGKVLLVERGSTVSGEYKSTLRQGMARIFVLWTRIKTPSGVVINLDSPGTDQLGGAGVPGYVDNHFWQRFGGALMLSLVDDVARGLTAQSGSGGNNQFNFNSTGDAAQNMAVEALKNTINIPPTLYKNQGEQVGIYIARDLDFSSVYDVAAQ